PRRVHAFHQYVVQVEDRERLRRELAERGIETGIHYPTPLHHQPAWEDAYESGLSFPRAEQLAARILSLPVVPDLTWDEVRYVAAAVRECARPLPAGALA
ncbi:MAG TPA: DegT/DnrJ/EryC1/StrS family aminotransferase, partial [Armatimonadota bacterium]|nr:DegT/DnrJ/EryC1/StrS family aminotransferase [Armatimonadota bacterium]